MFSSLLPSSAGCEDLILQEQEHLGTPFDQSSTLQQFSVITQPVRRDGPVVPRPSSLAIPIVRNVKISASTASSAGRTESNTSGSAVPPSPCSGEYAVTATCKIHDWLFCWKSFIYEKDRFSKEQGRTGPLFDCLVTPLVQMKGWGVASYT